MKKLLIRSCLIAGLAWTASCSSNKETAPQEPAPAPAVQPEQTTAADHLRSGMSRVMETLVPREGSW